MRKNLVWLWLMALTGWILPGCGAEKHVPSNTVVATTSLIHDALVHIAGDAIRVAPPLCGAGADPHSYEATPGDIKRLTEADLVFYNGLGLESHLEPSLERLDGRAVAVTRDIPRSQLLPWRESGEEAGHHHHHSQFDPHVWTDANVWMTCIQTIAASLSAQYPQHRATFEANAARYLAEVKAAHEAGLQAVAQLPTAKRVLVSNHETFHYFARAYGFEVRALMGISSESEAGVRDLQELADFIVARNIPVIFAEDALSKREMEALQAAVKARGGDVSLSASPLYTDALGSKSPADTYPGMLRANLETILSGLGAIAKS